MKIRLKHNRGIRIQSRIIGTAVMLLLQIAFLAFVAINISTGSVLIYTLSSMLGVITVAYIVNKRGNPSYKIMWIVFILVFPVFGITVYILWGGGRIFPNFKKRMQNCESHFLSRLNDDSRAHDKLRYCDLVHSRQAQYLSHESGYPLYTDSSTEYLSPGEAFLPRFLEELEKAEKYIFIEFFIIAEGKMWDSIHDILRRKAAEGVEVKIIFDDFGSIKRQHKDFISRLRSENIGVAIFNKIQFSLTVFLNNRNHRKIVVIDGKIAVTGGLNLADEYINEIERFGYWMDSAVIIKGSAVDSFVAMFLSIWEFTTRERLDFDRYIANCAVPCDGFVLPYCDDPLDDKNPAEGIYMQILNGAQKYVYITTPYLIIDSTMTATLKLAAKSGIDVRILTPAVPDKWYVHPVTQYSYLELLEAGVKIYEYTPGFVHSKLFVSDDSVATIGTVNMDYRSFALHFECGVWIAGNQTVKDIKNHFELLLTQSKEITLEEWKKSPLRKRFKRAILHLFAPFM